jgi:hypothetical protein
LRSVPKTAALMDQKDHSMTPVQRFWKNCLMKGSNVGLWGVWEQKWGRSVECAALHRWYCDEAGKLGVRTRASETEFGMQLNKLVPGLRRVRRWFKEYGKTGRRYEYDFPDLETCRTAFDAVMNCEYDWTTEEDPTVPT